MIKLAVSGCHGRMGQSILRLASEDNAFQITKVFERAGHPKANELCCGLATSVDYAKLEGCDVLIEFTTPEATMNNLAAALRNNVKLVIGTTGLSNKQVEEIKKASEKIPIVYSSNMSVGVNLTFKLTQLAAEKTKDVYQANISEAHHIHKKDAPSGTAKMIKTIIEEASGQSVGDVESIREGEIIGDHTIVFEGPQDTITITHHAKTRDIFAIGALVAAKFLADKTSGLFNMQDVLGLN